jgi:16S rRNA processing protein RimM
VARPNDKVCLGVIAGAHGVRGEVRIESFTADPAAIAAYGPLSDEGGERRLAIELVGASRGQLIARVAGIADRGAAAALKGLRLYVERARLPAPGADEYYHGDLLGLAVEGRDGGPFGVVKGLHEFGAGSVIEIERPSGAPIMLPFTRAAVPVIDLAAGRLVVDPPPGLVEPAAEVDGDGGEPRTKQAQK